jgi:hypothetical protein
MWVFSLNVVVVGDWHLVHIFSQRWWNPILSQNWMSFHQNHDVNMKFSYNLIIIYLQIDQIVQKYGQNGSKYWSICSPQKFTFELHFWFKFDVFHQFESKL